MFLRSSLAAIARGRVLCLTSSSFAITSPRQTLITRTFLLGLPFCSPTSFPLQRSSSSSSPFLSNSSLPSFLPMGNQGALCCSLSSLDSSQPRGSRKRCSTGLDEESRSVAPGTESPEAGVDRISCKSPDFESGNHFAARGAHDSLPTTADKETRLPGDPAEPSEIKRLQTGGTWFRITDACLLALHRGDITKWTVNGETDAIVNAANQRLQGGAGVDGAIHRAAGPELYEACRELPYVFRHIRCQTGGAVITSAFQLPVSKIIHAVGPIYEDKETSAPLLENAYKNSVSVAVQNNISYLCFPAISCGVYGYPYDEAAEIALRTVQINAHSLKEIHFVFFEEGPWLRWLSRADQSFEKLSQDQ